MAQEEEFNQGDTVEWNTPQGKTRGKVKKKLTSPTQVRGRSALPRREREERQRRGAQARCSEQGVGGCRDGRQAPGHTGFRRRREHDS